MSSWYNLKCIRYSNLNSVTQFGRVFVEVVNLVFTQCTPYYQLLALFPEGSNVPLLLVGEKK